MTAVLCYRLAFSGQWHEPPKRIWWQEDWRLCAEPIVFGFRVRSGCISHSSGDSVMDMNTLPINVSHPESRVSVIGILTRYGMDVSAFESQQEKWFFFPLPETSRPTLGCTQSSVQEVIVFLTGLLQPRHWADRRHSLSAYSYPPVISTAGRMA